MEPSPSRLRAREFEAIRDVHHDPEESITNRFVKLNKEEFSYEQTTYEDAEVMESNNSFSLL